MDYKSINELYDVVLKIITNHISSVSIDKTKKKIPLDQAVITAKYEALMVLEMVRMELNIDLFRLIMANELMTKDQNNVSFVDKVNILWDRFNSEIKEVKGAKDETSDGIEGNV